MTNFKVGQKVVCVKPHSQGFFKTGQIFTIKNICIYECCKKVHLEFSDFNSGFSRTYCNCDNSMIGDWFDANLFRPLTYASSTSEILAKFPLTEEMADVEIKEHQLINN